MDAVRIRLAVGIAAGVWALTTQAPESAMAQSVQFWLDCEECKDQLDSLQFVDQHAVPLLAQVLRDGPPPSSVTRLQKYLDSLHGALARHVRTHPADGPLPDRARYIQSYVGAFSDRYRVRAAIGLATIGGLAARAALDRALADSSRPRVWATVRFAIDSICGLKPDPGQCR